MKTGVFEINMLRTNYLLLSAFLLFLIQSCGPGIQDFEKPLTDNYTLNRVSSYEICISPKGGWNDNEEIIPSKVVKLNVFENYIIVQRLESEDEKPYDSVDYNKTFTKDRYDYWIIDSDKKQIFKKLSYSQFLTKLDSLKIPKNLKLIDVYEY
ncbi:DUF3997 domain-containing protein [Flavobacterium sp. W22_SRS_FK3]|uniref:DUF3997 domain-containing protein n=1 Tax=Flavobacterium sp. W22_SRS_FK3 TaxID=3240275 RepID=UPI003F8E488F